MDIQAVIKDIENKIMNDEMTYSNSIHGTLHEYYRNNNIPYDDFRKVRKHYTKSLQNKIVEKRKKLKYDNQMQNMSRQLKTIYITGDDKSNINTVLYHMKDRLSDVHGSSELEFNEYARNKQRIHTALRKLGLADVITIKDLDPTYLSHELIMNVLDPNKPYMHTVKEKEHYFTARHVLITNELPLWDWLFNSYWYNFNKHTFREKKIKTPSNESLLNQEFIRIIDKVLNRFPYIITINSRESKIVISKASIKPYIFNQNTVSKRDINNQYDVVNVIPFDSLNDYLIAPNKNISNLYEEIIHTIYN